MWVLNYVTGEWTCKGWQCDRTIPRDMWLKSLELNVSVKCSVFCMEVNGSCWEKIIPVRTPPAVLCCSFVVPLPLNTLHHRPTYMIMEYFPQGFSDTQNDDSDVLARERRSRGTVGTPNPSAVHVYTQHAIGLRWTWETFIGPYK